MQLFKKRFHPCGGFFLEGALKWLIPTNVVMLFVGLIMLGFDMYRIWDEWKLEWIDKSTGFYVRCAFYCGYLVHVIFALPMDVYLYRAYKNKNLARLKVWCVVNFFNSCWVILNYWVHTAYSGFNYETIPPFNFYCVYKFYMCVVVYYYGLEVQDELEVQAGTRTLTDEELKEFEEGMYFPETSQLDIDTQNLMEKVQYQRYKRDEFEISMDKLRLDNHLGKGAYGIVYRGIFFKESGAEIPVAVKTFQSGLLDAACFKALLSELKVMTYLGQHDNIVNLIGAVTTEIQNRRLHMVIEFCPFGSLLEYLRASRGLYQNNVINGEIQADRSIKSGTFEECLSTHDLIKFALDTTRGMAYLEERKVVHGDLAGVAHFLYIFTPPAQTHPLFQFVFSITHPNTCIRNLVKGLHIIISRNLLLTESKQIKIADFGLARQLYQYATYVKRQNAPLPWRWLAIESLTDMNFSSKSDCWAFGIVLHEIFTLGEVPYNVKQFTLEFVEELRNGIRLEQPVFCPNDIYKSMRDCWQESPETRPSFQDLQLTLQNLWNLSKTD